MLDRGGYPSIQDNNSSADESQGLLSTRPQPENYRATRGPHVGSSRHLYLLLAITGGLDLTKFLLTLPLTQLYESIACYQYYAVQDPSRFKNPYIIPSALCKIDAVQNELAMVRGGEMMVTLLPGLLLSVPYAMLATRWGHRLVFLLGILGGVAALISVLIVTWFWWIFPLRLIWLAYCLMFIGGGPAVVTATVCSMITDLTFERERAYAFMLLTSSVMIADAVATPLASISMRIAGVWTPVVLAIGVGAVTCTLSVFTVETQLESACLAQTEQDGLNSLDREVDGKDILVSPLSHKWSMRTWKIYSPRLDQRGYMVLLALVSTFCVNAIGYSSIFLVVQYASKRFGWSIAEAGLLLVARDVAAAFVFLVLVPRLGKNLQDMFNLNGQLRDLWVCRILSVVAPLGFLIMAVASNVATLACGLGLTAIGFGSVNLTRSVTSTMVDPGSVVHLNGIISMVDTIGSLVSGITLVKIYEIGLQVGTRWHSLPFGVAAVLTALTASVLWISSPPNASLYSK